MDMCSREKAVENAVASVEMEGFHVDEETKKMCERLLKGEITYDEYLAFVLQSLTVPA